MVKPISPERLMLLKDYRDSRMKEIEHLIKKLWPEHYDNHPCVSEHFEEEFDKAISRIKKRKNRFIKNRPPKSRGGQTRWGKTEYKYLLINFERLEESFPIVQDRLEILSDMYGIGTKKIAERLKLARESENI